MSMLRLAARMDDLDDALACVQSFCDAEAIAEDDALRLRLVVEELFTNTVEHGGNTATCIEVGLLRLDRTLVALDYADDGAPFDPRPLADPAAMPAPDAPATRIGGVGLRLVGHWCKRIGYARDSGSNRLRLELPLRGC